MEFRKGLITMNDMEDIIREFEEKRKNELKIMKEKVKKLNEKYLNQIYCTEDLFYEISDMWFLLRNTTTENDKIYGTVVKVSDKKETVMKILKKRNKEDDLVIRTQCEVPKKYKYLINKVMTCSELKDNIEEQDQTDGLWVAFTNYINDDGRLTYNLPNLRGEIINITKAYSEEFDIRWEMTLNKPVRFQFIANNDEALQRYFDNNGFIYSIIY